MSANVQAIVTQIENELMSTTVSYPTWKKNVKAGKYNPKNGSTTAWGRAFALLSQVPAASGDITTTSKIAGTVKDKSKGS